MAVFTYIAKDKLGARRSGTVDANTESLAVDLLKSQELYVISLERKKESLLDSIMEIRGIPEGDIVTFTRQFSTMISAGLPLARALEVLAEQATNEKLKKVIMEVLRDVEGGTPLSQALSRFPQVFSATYVALVSAGEASGKLDEILKRLANTMESERELKSKLKGAMIYPAIVMLAMVGVFVMLMVFVIPTLADMYDSLDVDLPAATKMLIGISNIMVERKFLIIIGVIGLFFFYRWFAGTDEGKKIKTTLLFGLPVFGNINRQKELTSFTRTLSLLIGAAIPIVEALNIVAQVMVNYDLKEAAYEAATNVEKGNSLSEYFRHKKIFPPLVGQMANVGEETGQMDAVLDRVANYFEGETDNAIRGLQSALEPFILILLGGMVGMLIIAIITPIYKITTAI